MPLPGLAGYGASKAALRMSGTILAAELDAGAPRDATILSYEPGLVDTPMQTAVRTSSADRLPIVQMFRDWAASGALVPAGLPAREMADYLDTDGHPRWLERRYTPPGG
jgi:NAD(P)-dependent dehydrogenase (short-subunit alcohol dehydrogenase family)